MIALATDDRVLARFARELAPPVTLAPPVITARDDDRAAARLTWAARIVDEYRSVVVFGELLTLLAELEAPFPALCAIQHLIGDELRHARLCADVVGWLGGADDLAVDLADLGLPPRDDDEPRAHRALMIVARELVVAEEESIVVLAACRDATTEPAVHRVLADLLRDEVRHAATGRSLLKLLAADPRAGSEADLAALMAADRAALRELYRAAAVGGPGRALGASITTADLDAVRIERPPDQGAFTSLVLRP